MKLKPEYVLFVLVCVLYWANKMVSESLGLPVFFTSWFSDVLAIPFIMLLFRIFLGFFENVYRNKALPVYFILTAVIVYAVWFEWYMPSIDRQFTGDWVDALAYLLGGILYYLFERIRFKKSV